MKRIVIRNLIGIVAAGFALCASAAAPASGVTLNAVLYPDDQKIDLAFQTTDRAPAATLKGNVRIEQAQAQIEISWKKLEPALLFGGDVTCWVIWTATPDGTIQNQGELPVRSDRSGDLRFSAPSKNFAVMVTAEPLPGVRKPSDLVAFISTSSPSKLAKNSTFSFAAFRETTKRDVESIAGLEYKDKTPVELMQARKSVEIMDRFEAEKYAETAARDARTGLSQAEDAYQGRVGKSKDVPDLSRRAITLASQAVVTAIRTIDQKKVADAEAQRLAELNKSKAEAESERAARAKTETELTSVQEQRRQLEVENQKVQAEKAKVEAERDALARRLSGALGKVASTEKTGRGLVLSLSGGILFNTGKSDLRPDAKVTLAKLSGILLMIPTADIQIEGHTDSTGTEDTNAKLSLERATAVMTFLESQGVENTRMRSKGLGSASPIASNDAADGRAKNRRVEIVVPDSSATAENRN